jgi:hypothetical protein
MSNLHSIVNVHATSFWLTVAGATNNDMGMTWEMSKRQILEVEEQLHREGLSG